MDELPPGSICRVTVEGLGPLAYLFNIAGAEQTIGHYLAPASATIIDVYAQNSVGYVDFQVSGSPVLPILIAIAVGLVALGVIVALITVWVKGPEAVTPILAPINSVVTLLVLFLFVSLMSSVTPMMQSIIPGRRSK